MEKKYFLAVPLFFLIYSFLFPFKGGTDMHFIPSGGGVDSGIESSIVPSHVIQPSGMIQTCYVSNKCITAAGFLDGTILVDGKPLENSSPGKYKTVYAIASSDDGRYLSVIAGVYPRNLYVYQKKQDNWNQVHVTALPDDARGVPFLAISSNMLLYEDTDGISVLNLAKSSHSKMIFSGVLKDVGYGPDQDYVWVVSGDDTGHDQIHMFLYNGSCVASARYDGKESLKALKVAKQ